jgi:outer membrane protein OmpA-like peptidoglycan-associated protein
VARDVMRLAEEARYAAAERSAEARAAAERSAARQRIAEAEQDAERSRREAERLRLEREREEERARQAREEADAYAEAQRRAQEQAAAAQAAAEEARLAAQQAQHDKAELQERLYRSLSAVLETRREARGLIVNLSDVLFDTGRATLKPGAREKLSRLSGILLAYPGEFHVEVEGHTDSVGSEEYNQRLSQARAESVRTYLQQAGIDAARFTRITGFGESRPVATNVNAAGRQMNRRVELVITDLEGEQAAQR